MNRKVILSICALVLLSLSYLLFEAEAKDLIKFLFENNVFLILHTLAVGIIFVIHFFFKIETSSELKILHSENVFFEMVLNIGTFFLIGSSALALLKGVYLQEFFNIEYFKSYGKLDIWTIFAVSCSLLWYTSTRIVGLTKEAIFYKPQEIERNS